MMMIWFSDEMLFTLTTLKSLENHWHMVQQRIKRLSKNAFSRMRTALIVRTRSR